MTYAGYLKTPGFPASPIPAFNAKSDEEARTIANELAVRVSRPGIAYAATVWESREGKARVLAA